MFQNLNETRLGDEVIYNNSKYIVGKIEVLEKADVDMSKILAPTEKDTLMMMTCAGTDLGNGDATHRLILTATISSNE